MYIKSDLFLLASSPVAGQENAQDDVLCLKLTGQKNSKKVIHKWMENRTEPKNAFMMTFENDISCLNFWKV